ncbi:uncharacterized protein LOC127836157 [Dreissena polymorpha]|uniref:Uncharacterized protein n=1 Tax=Dreissena polymorpha TaxID=45954 RepID=A0A9D4GA41_DREPO|nr:uncharacterized protein LOC127836157 [Dreissena polymorpha]KAH3813406.1 hypothetical protein DPMN_141862 [Dreissena polymorpha]
MAVASSKVALHLYLNNPHGLLAATIPNYVLVNGNAGLASVQAIVRSNPIPEEASGVDSESVVSVVRKANVVKFGEALPPIPDFNERSNQKTLSKEKLPSNSSKGAEINSFELNTPLPEVKRAVGMVPKLPPYKQSQSGRSSGATGEISPRGGDGQTVPSLGFSWSLNLDKRSQPEVRQKPPPPSLLEKLGRLKVGEPIGIVKLKRNKNHPAIYQVSKMSLQDKDGSQRKMSERLHEWLDEYTEVSQKQQAYLQRIHALRRGLEQRQDQHVLETVGRMRNGPRYKHRRKYPLYSLTRMEEAATNQGPSPFPNRPCISHNDSLKQSGGDGSGYKGTLSKIKIVPRAKPRKLEPIVKPGNADVYEKLLMNSNSKPHGDTPRPDMSKMKTEYETFESIARRNHLNLTHFYNSSLSHRRLHRRKPVAMSTVTMIDESPEETEQTTQFITDIAAKKHMLKTGKGTV